MIVTAAQSGIQKLYHYEKFDPAYLEDTLANQHVHFSNPEKFNDPWDCSPRFDTSRLTDPSYRALCVQGVFRRVPLPDLSANKRRQYEAELQVNCKLFKETIHALTKNLRTTIAELWRIYCLTPHSNAPLMWAHYADGHRGICLEFDTGQAVVGAALQVQYHKSLPTLDVLALAPDEEVVQTMLISKSCEWSYEDEYRVLSHHGDLGGSTVLSPSFDSEYLSLPINSLTSVIAGCRADFNAIKALVDKQVPGLPVKRAVQAPDTYSLSIQG